MEPDLVIFDCDGVLVDSERLEVEVMAQALGWLSINHDPHALQDRNRGGSLASLFADIAALADRELPDGFEQRYRQTQLTGLRHVTAVPGAHECVNAAPSERAVASSGPMYKMEVSLSATGLWDLFDPHIYSCYDIGSHKPEPDIYLHAAERFGVLSESCVVIEDSVNGVTAGFRAGMSVIGLARDIVAAELVAAGAAVTVTDLIQAPAAWRSL